MRGYCYGLFRTEIAPKPEWPKCPQWGVAVTVYSGLKKPPNLTGQDVRNEGLLLRSIQDWEIPQTWLAKVSAMRGYCYGLFRTEKAPKPDWPKCPQWAVAVTVYSGLRKPPNLTGLSVRNKGLLLQSFQDWEIPQTWLAKVSAMRGCCYGPFRTECLKRKPPNLTGQSVRNEGLLLRSIQDWESPQTWLAKVSAMRGYCYGLSWTECLKRKPPNLTGQSVRNEGLLLRSIQDWESPQTWLAKVSAMRGYCYGLSRTECLKRKPPNLTGQSVRNEGLLLRSIQDWMPQEKAPKPDWPKCPQWGVVVTIYSGLRKPPNLTGQSVRNEGLLLRSIQDWMPQEKAPKPDWPKCPQWGVAVTVYSGLRNPPNLTGQSVCNEGLLLRSIQDWMPQEKAPKPDWPKCRNEGLLLRSIQDWESPQTWLAKMSAMRGYCYDLFRTEKSPKPDWPKCPQWSRGCCYSLFRTKRHKGKPPNLSGQSVRNEGLLLQSIQDWMPPGNATKPDWPNCRQWGVAVMVYSGLNASRESPQTWLAKVSAMRGCFYDLFRTEHHKTKPPNLTGQSVGNEGLSLRYIQDWMPQDKAPKPDWPKCPQWAVAVMVYSGLRNPPNLTGQSVGNEGLPLRSIQDWMPQEIAPKPDWPKCRQ